MRIGFISDNNIAVYKDGILVTFSELDAESFKINLENITVDNLSKENLVRKIVFRKMIKSFLREPQEVRGDLEASLGARLNTRVEGKPRRRSSPGLSDWDLAIGALRARLSVTLNTDTGAILAKLEGWPELDLRLTSCNSKEMTPQVESFEVVIKNIVSQAIRYAQLDLR